MVRNGYMHKNSMATSLGALEQSIVQLWHFTPEQVVKIKKLFQFTCVQRILMNHWIKEA